MGRWPDPRLDRLQSLEQRVVLLVCDLRARLGVIEVGMMAKPLAKALRFRARLVEAHRSRIGIRGLVAHRRSRLALASRYTGLTRGHECYRLDPALRFSASGTPRAPDVDSQQGSAPSEYRSDRP